MTPDELKSRFIHEKIMGLHWHEDGIIMHEGKGFYIETIYVCSCGKRSHSHVSEQNPDYTQWEHYGRALEKLGDKVDEIMMGT